MAEMSEIPVTTCGLSYYELIGCVLLGFDFCLTFSQEVERVWKQKLTGPVLLFLVNRYLGLIYQIICLALVVNAKVPTLNVPIQNFKEVTAIVIVIVCELIMTIRVYALYSCNNTLLGFLLTLIAVQLILTVCFDFVPAVAETLGELHKFSEGPSGFTTNSFVLWTSALFIEINVFVLTLRKTHGCLGDGQNAPLLHLFFRDGIMYFLVICASNLMNILVNTLLLNLGTLPEFSLSSQFCTSITSLFVSRLVLNIRIGSETDLYHSEHQRSILAFAVGNLGESMDELFDENIDEVDNEEG